MVGDGGRWCRGAIGDAGSLVTRLRRDLERYRGRILVQGNGPPRLLLWMRWGYWRLCSFP